MNNPSILAIVGPTAVGKSDVAGHVALARGAEIVNADSMQVYRSMDIGTAKTPPEERSVTHHCLDIVEPGAPYSAALFQSDARAAIESILDRGARAMLVGGTGLYVRAALDEMTFPVGEQSSHVRRTLEARLADDGPDALYADLQAADPPAAALIHRNNVRRVIRALEMHAHGLSYADQAAGFTHREFHYPHTMLIGLTMDRDALYERIDHRVDAMIAVGLLDEVRGLLDRGFLRAITAAQAIGYKELVPVLRGETPLDEAVASIKQSSRRYAKRQLTWFRADPRITWLDVTGLSATQAVAHVLDLIESSEH